MPANTLARRYESSEIRPKWFLIGLALFAIVAFLLGFVLMRFYQYTTHSAASEPALRSVMQGKMSENDAPPLQPQVGHEMLDAQDLYAMRQREGEIFDKLGWSWSATARQREIPAAVIEAVRQRTAATRPSGMTAAARGGQ